MIKINLQFFGGSGSRLGGSTVRTNTNASVSATSTGGRVVEQSGGQWYGENDNGYAVSVLDGGRDDINMFRYGSRQIYEITYYTPAGASVRGTDVATTKAEALKRAKDYLKDTKDRQR